MSTILGLAPGGVDPSMGTPFHDASTALVDSGRLVALIEEERPSRSKRAIGRVPSVSIRVCLEQAGVELRDVDAVAVGWRLDETDGPNAEERVRAWIESAVQQRAPGVTSSLDIRFVAHHYAHACCGYFASGFPSAAGIVVDGRSEREAITIWSCRGDGVELVRQWPRSASLGRLYAAATEWSGLGRWAEGKFMGLASYGNPTDFRPAERSPDGFRYPGFAHYLADAGDYRSELDQAAIVRHREHLATQFASVFPHERGDGSEIMAYAGFAASIQASLEDAFGGLVDLTIKETGEQRLFLAGGVALNCSANGRMAADFPDLAFYVPPIPHDAGVSYGAAVALCPGEAAGAPRLDHALFGFKPSKEECLSAVESSGFPHEVIGDDVRAVAAAIADGAVVAWFDGQAEVGQRALGSRSIFADPRRRATTVRVNRIKGRELWRPLAPSIQAESFHDYFEATASAGELARFMLGAVKVKPEKRQVIPACTHVDGTARPQVVSQVRQPRFWSLLSEFRSLTGVPALLNTSFNLAGEPIVHSAMDAVDVFRRSEIDALVLGDFFMRKATP